MSNEGSVGSAVRSQSKTYVVQVQSGREEHARLLIQRMLPCNLLDEVFVPTYTKQVRRAGKWQDEQFLLIPGYLYLSTRDIDTVVQQLRVVPALTRVLGTDTRFVPLTSAEIVWLEELTEPGKRSIGVSKGFIEGDQVRIVSGPLKGHEALIKKVNRHKRIADIEFRILGRSTRVRVGLEVVSVRS